MEKILSISLKLNFTPNTLGSYGLRLKRTFEKLDFPDFSNFCLLVGVKHEASNIILPF